MARMTRLDGIPSAEALPQVADLINERKALVSERGKVSADGARLRSRTVEGEARKADAELLSDTARKGGNIVAVGEPNMDKLRAAVAEVDTKLKGLNGAIAKVDADLVEAMTAKVDEIAAHVGGVIDEAAKRYGDAVAVAVEGRRDLQAAVAVRSFVEKVTDTVPDGPQSALTRSTLPGRMPINADAAFAGMREECERKGRAPRRNVTKAPPFKPDDGYTYRPPLD